VSEVLAMTENKKCAVCGKEVYLLSWETKCPSCGRKDYIVKKSIETAENGYSYCEEDIYCPHCGKCHEVYSWYDDELYEDGEHDFTCEDCDEEFTVITNISYSFDTEKKEV
jgi:transposase-like protein